MRTQQIARAGVSIALLALSAWVTVPIGPIPVTLQTMVLAILPAALDRKTACTAVAVYLLLGAIGLPVFSGFGGGIGALAGPTGGFLWGFLLGMLAGTTAARLLPARLSLFARSLAASVTLLLISYACGAAQLMVIGSLDVAAALAVAVLPFIVPDAIKLAVGTSIGCSVARAAGHVPARR